MELWYWYSSEDTKPRGPFEIGELKELVRIGQLRQYDKVWREDFEDWIPASKIEFLYPKPDKGFFESAKNFFKIKS